MKIRIPLSFLLFLNYFSLFREFGDIGGSIGFLTTAFLSGIALYFSTERPQPLRMTTVDLIFLWYYVLTGVTIIVTSVTSLFGEKIFLITMTGLKLVVPIGFIGICIFLFRRIKSNRLKPRINWNHIRAPSELLHLNQAGVQDLISNLNDAQASAFWHWNGSKVAQFSNLKEIRFV